MTDTEWISSCVCWELHWNVALISLNKNLNIPTNHCKRTEAESFLRDFYDNTLVTFDVKLVADDSEVDYVFYGALIFNGLMALISLIALRYNKKMAQKQMIQIGWYWFCYPMKSVVITSTNSTLKIDFIGIFITLIHKQIWNHHPKDQMRKSQLLQCTEYHWIDNTDNLDKM